jgi:dienelactone hydrolase
MRSARRPHPALAVTLATLLAIVVSAAPLRAAEILQESLRIPALVDGARVELDALVMRPDDQRPHPLALINHGSPRDSNDRSTISPFGMSAQAQAFARRGFVAVSFTRRGYGRSEGGWAETYGSCADPDYARAGLAGAADIAAVAQFMEMQPYVSKDKWISVGVSAGAFATVALSAEAPSGLVAALAFAPGRGSTSADTVCAQDRLVAAFALYGRTSRIPVLWVSAANDRFFGPQLVGQLTSAFTQGAARLSFVATPPFGEDGHALFSARGAAIWSPIVDRFLSAHGLMADAAAASGAKRISAPGGLDARGQQAFATYLESGPNKAFAVGEGGHFGWASGRLSSEEAKRAALYFCANAGASNCAIVNLNDDPVH